MFTMRIITTLCVALVISTLSVTNNFTVHSQSNTHTQQGILMNSTSRGSLEVKLEPIPYPIETNKDTEFKVSFLKPNSSILQEDIDFDFIILKDGKAVAVIELKGTNTPDLGVVEQQAFSYKNNQTGCEYVVISNFEKLRFFNIGVFLGE